MTWTDVAFVGVVVLCAWALRRRRAAPLSASARAESEPQPERAGPAPDEVDLGALVLGATAGLERVRYAGPDRPLTVVAGEGCAEALRTALLGVREVTPEAETLVVVSEYRGEGRLRVGQRPHTDETTGPSEPYESLLACARAGGGEGWVHAGAGFGVQLPLAPTMPPAEREALPDVHDLPWEEHYAALLARASFSTLRQRAYRFARWAQFVAYYALEHRLATILCPGVGLAVDPWVFAAFGGRVVALDRARTPLAALAAPDPRVYSAAGHDAWDAEQSVVWVNATSPHSCGVRTPDLGDAELRARLAARVCFLQGDQARLPLPDAAVDVVFATNALPRGDDAEREAVYAEWLRVLQPGGLIYASMHNAYGICDEARARFAAAGLTEIDLGTATGTVEAPPPRGRGAFFVRGSSG